MSTTVKVDAQGRVVIPLRERERLGVVGGGTLELVPTGEGVLLERRQHATVEHDDRGVPVVTIDRDDTVTNDDTLAAIHRERDRS